MVSAREIPPGGEGKIKVTVATSGRAGKLSKTVTVHSNDPKTPQLRLKVHGMVEVIAGFEPRFLSLGTVTQGTKVTRTVKLVGKQLATLKLTGLKSDQPDKLGVKLVETAGARALEVSFDSRKHEGRFRGAITAQTNLEQAKLLRLTVWGNVVGDLVPDRRFVLFAAFEPKSPPTAQLRIRSTANRRFRVLGVRDPAGVVTGRAKRLDQGWEVTLTLAKRPALRSGHLKIRTDRRDQREIEVRYSMRSTSARHGRAERIWRRLDKGAIPAKRPPSAPH